MPSLLPYGGRIITVDGRRVVEMRDPNDNSRSVYQYRATGSTLEVRMIVGTRVIKDWTPRTPEQLRQMRSVYGWYHPILSELGLAPAERGDDHPNHSI